jgi:hypothetical protein
MILNIFRQTQSDTVQRIQKMIPGTWVDVETPNQIINASPDTLRIGSDCLLYKIKTEKPRNELKVGEYWFGFRFHN